MSQNNLTKKDNLIQVIKFVLFSCSAGLIEAGSCALLLEIFSLPYRWAYLTALILSVLWNFTLNRRYTFQSANNVPIAMVKVALFYCVFTPASTYLGDYYVKTVGINEYLVLAVTMVLNLTTEFLYDRFVVFRNSIGTRQDKKKAENM